MMDATQDYVIHWYSRWTGKGGVDLCERFMHETVLAKCNELNDEPGSIDYWPVKVTDELRTGTTTEN